LVVVVLMLSATPAFSMGSMYSPYDGKGPPPVTAIPTQMMMDTSVDARRSQRIRSELVALHDEGIKLRDGDGGKLTEEHRAYLQSKLDAIRAEARGGKTEAHGGN
jgi:hypothetical protein